MLVDNLKSDDHITTSSAVPDISKGEFSQEDNLESGDYNTDSSNVTNNSVQIRQVDTLQYDTIHSISTVCKDDNDQKPIDNLQFGDHIAVTSSGTAINSEGIFIRTEGSFLIWIGQATTGPFILSVFITSFDNISIEKLS